MQQNVHKSNNICTESTKVCESVSKVSHVGSYKQCAHSHEWNVT